MINVFEYNRAVEEMREHEESVLTADERKAYEIFKKFMNLYNRELALETSIFRDTLRGENND